VYQGDKTSSNNKKPQQQNLPNEYVDEINMQHHIPTEQLLIKDKYISIAVRDILMLYFQKIRKYCLIQ